MHRLLPFLCCLVLPAAVAAAPELRPLGWDDVARAADVPAPWLALLKTLNPPADALTLTDGTTLLVEPLAEAPQPGDAEATFTAHPPGEPDKARKLGGTDLKGYAPFEDRVLASVNSHLDAKGSTVDDAIWAERVLRAALRWHRSRRAAPHRDVSWKAVGTRLSERLMLTRRFMLRRLLEVDQADDALAWSELWLPLYAPGSPLRDDIRAAWVSRGLARAKANDFSAARTRLDRLEEHFPHSAAAEPLRRALRARAEELLKEAGGQTGGKALQTLDLALALWPRLPGGRDALERRHETYRVVRVAVRALPEALSPATAWSDCEKQALHLIFEGMYVSRDRPALGRSYAPALAHTLEDAGGLRRVIRLRRDLYWADGEPLTAADVRHTALLTRGSAAFREALELPRLGAGSLRLDLSYRQGSLDPLAPLAFAVLPQTYRGKPLRRTDDPDFAKQPVGSGPYQYTGRLAEGGSQVARFHANPHFVRAGRPNPGSLREIRLVSWADGLSDTAKEPTHLVWNAQTDRLDDLRKRGFTDVRTLTAPRVWCLAINRRRPVLADVSARRALAHAIDREALLTKFFRAGTKHHHAANGPFPRGSWAAAPATRVPVELYSREKARSLAKKIPATANLEWVLKYPADDKRVAGACAEIARQVSECFAEAGVKVAIRPLGLSPQALRVAAERGDYDLLYGAIDRADEPLRLWSLFNAPADGQSGDSAITLGAVADAKLQGLLRSAQAQRRFGNVQEVMQAIHAHLAETMPLVPLWQFDVHAAVRPELHVPRLEALALFESVLEWKLSP